MFPQILQSTIYPGRNYELLRSIGNGGEATIYLGIFEGQHCAIKIYSRQISEGEKEINKQLIKNNFAHLVQIYDQISESIIVMELANDNLQNFMQSDQFKNLDVYEKHKLFQQIVEGVWELDGLGYYHRDIKPLNILYFQHKNQVVLKLSDYGIIKQIEAKQVTSNIGTQYYQAPEQRTNSYDKSTDIWQLGIIWLMMMGFENLKQINQIKTQSQESINQLIQQQCQMMDIESQNNLVKMLQLNPKQRLSLRDLRCYLISLVQFDEIKINLQGWQRDLKELTKSQMELQNLIDIEDLQSFQKIIEQQKNLLEKMQGAPLSKGNFHRDLIFQSKELLNAYDRLTRNLKNKLKNQLIANKIRILNLTNPLNELQIDKVQSQKSKEKLRRQIDEILSNLEIIDKNILTYFEKIEDVGPIQSYESLKNFNQNFLIPIMNQQSRINEFNDAIQQISLQIVDVIQKEKSQLEGLNFIIQKFSDSLNVANDTWLQNSMHLLQIEQEQQNLEIALTELQELVNQGNNDLLLFDKLMIYDQNEMLKQMMDQQRYKINQIAFLIEFCSIYKNIDIPKVINELDEIKKILDKCKVMIDFKIQCIDVHNSEQMIQNLQKEVNHVIEKLQYKLKQSHRVQTILKYLQFIIKLHNLRRLKYRLLEATQVTKDKKCKGLQNFGKYFPELKDLDCRIKYFEKLIYQIHMNQEISYQEFEQEEEIDENIDKQLEIVLNEIKQKNEQKLKLKFLSQEQIDIIMKKVYSLEFNQGLILSLLVWQGEQSGHKT